MLNLKSKIIPGGQKVLAIYTENSENGKIKYLQKHEKYELKRY